MHAPRHRLHQRLSDSFPKPPTTADVIPGGPLPLSPNTKPSASMSAAAAARATRRLLSCRLQATTARPLHARASQGAARDASGSFIHPAAIVHPDASIGQFSGSGAVIGADIPGQTIIGENNVIGHYAVVGVKCQDLKYKVIGDNNLIMGSCHIAHDCKIGNNNIFANNTLFAGHVVVEDCTHTAGAVVVHQFCHIGSYSFLGGGSVVTQDVPRYMMVAGDRAELRGLNVEGLRRNGFSDQEVRRLRKAYQKVFMPTVTSETCFEDRLAELEREIELSQSPAVSCMVKSIRMSFDQGRRGICKFRSWNSS
nr:unnamed protein product [Digitaria exilis]